MVRLCSYCLMSPTETSAWTVKQRVAGEMIFCSLKCLAVWCVLYALDPKKIAKFADDKEPV